MDAKKKILIIEDDLLTKRFYDLIFRHSEFEIIQSEEIDEIFKILETEEIKIIILDINLRNTTLDGKVISGIDLSRMIKENENLKDVKIIIVSAYMLNQEHPDFISSKADSFILKPIDDFNKFLGVIRKFADHG